MTALRLVSAQSRDLEQYLELLEEVADWLAIRGIWQWRPGNFRGSADYYAESIKRKEVQLAFVGDELVGTLRLLLREPIVWPEVTEDDAVYVYNLAVKRTWTGHEAISISNRGRPCLPEFFLQVRSAYLILLAMAGNGRALPLRRLMVSSRSRFIPATPRIFSTASILS